MVVTLTLLKFLLVAVLRGNFQSSKTAQYSKCLSGVFSHPLHNTKKSLIFYDRSKKIVRTVKTALSNVRKYDNYEN